MAALFGRKQEFNPYRDNDPDAMIWMLYIKGKTRRPFHQWLERVLPSKVQKSDGFGWISVSRPSPIKCCDEDEKDLEGLYEAWDEYLESGNEVTYPIIERLAKEFNILCGKWLLFVNSGGKVDHIWSLISTAIIENDDLACFSAKVSTSDEDGSHVICIYNKNFTDKHQVMSSELAIRSMGIKAKLQYKPDVYTDLDIYAGNKWKLRPYIMVSNYDIKQHKSIVKEII